MRPANMSKDKVLPFSDREEAVKVALSLGGRAA